MNYQFSEHALSLLNNYYMKDGEAPTEAFRRAAYAYTPNKELAERITKYANDGWFMFSSPILSNAGRSGLPISCFLTYVEDTVESLIEHTNELRWMSVMGGGVGGHWSHVRSVSKKAPGPIPFLKTVDSDMLAYSQGSTRRGSYAAYMDISHPDIIEFLNIRMPTGGDSNRKCLNIHNAINITDAFMNAVYRDKEWQLIDPHSKEVKDTVNARELWHRILEVRFRTGEPYIHFIDTSNKALPQSLKDQGLQVLGSNLCSEITLPTNFERSAVCCLSSLNLEYFDEWKDTSIVQDLVEFLDDVLQYFIDKAPDHLSKAIYSAKRERSLGLGAMGFHSYLQKHNVAFESMWATVKNRQIFEHIKSEALIATKRLGELKGAYLDDTHTGHRNSHLLAIAPNANSSIILETSPSIEPWKSNAFTYRTRAGSFLQFNKYLLEILKTKGDEAWLQDTIQSVILNQGSVQHLDCLDEHQKNVFKTAFELDQMWIIEHAGVRQEWICQAQSVNLFFPANTDVNYVNLVHLAAHKKGLKSLYYLRTTAGVIAEKVSTQIERRKLKDVEECLSCQG